LIFGEALFERGHGLAALTDFVEEFAVGRGTHARRVGEIRRLWIVERGVVTVGFAGVAVAGTTFVEIERADGLENSVGRLERVFQLFGFDRDGPGTILVDGVKDGAGDNEEKQDEKRFAYL